MLCLVSFAAWAGVSRDANGWTVVTPSTSTRIIYVSNSLGNDSWSGLLPAPNGGNTDGPIKTLTKVHSVIQSRPCPQDLWILLKAGDVWHEQYGLGIYGTLGGPSADQPMMFSSYGTGARPQIRPVNNPDVATALFRHINGDVSAHVFLIGLDFYDANRDPSPSNPDYIPNDDSWSGGFSWVQGGGDDILIEDCAIRFMRGGGIGIQGNDPTTGPLPHPNPKNITIRRNVISDLYETTGGERPQGIYLEYVTGITIEENIFAHNGWNDTVGAAPSIFNHDLYIVASSSITIRNNLTMKSSSLSMKFVDYSSVSLPSALKDITIENNLYFEGEIGIQMLGGWAAATGPTYDNLAIRDNVFLQIDRDNPTKRWLGYGMEIHSLGNSAISHNIFSDFSAPLPYINGVFGIGLFCSIDTQITSNVAIRDNLFYRVNYAPLIIRPNSTWSNISVINNSVQDPNLGAAMNAYQGTLPDSIATYSNNVYSPSPGANPNRFAMIGPFPSGITYVSSTTWVAQSGETGMQINRITYPDPNRNLETYAASLTPSMTLAQFEAAIRTLSKSNWDKRFMAPAINDYIRAGFGLPPYTPSGKTPSAPRGLRIR
jgi:hypothetical protein